MKSFHVFLSTHVSASALHLGVAYSKGSTTPPCSALLSKSASRLQPPASYSVIAGCIKTFQMQSYDTDTLFRRGGGVGGAPADGGHATAVASSTAALVGASDPRSTSSSDRNVPQTAFFNGQVTATAVHTIMYCSLLPVYCPALRLPQDILTVVRAICMWILTEFENSHLGARRDCYSRDEPLLIISSDLMGNSHRMKNDIDRVKGEWRLKTFFHVINVRQRIGI